MKPSWLAGALSGVDMQEAFTLLDRLYGLRELQMQVKVGKSGVGVSQPVMWVNPAQVLRLPDILGTATSLRRTQSGWVVSIARVLGGSFTRQAFGGFIEADHVVVAAGVWCNELAFKDRAKHPEAIHVDGLEGRVGAALLWQHEQVPGDGFIAPWAPFKQVIAFNRGDGLWAGDGSAIKAKNWTADHEHATLARCRDAIWPLISCAPSREPKVLVGQRPYVKGAKPCVAQEVARGLWVVTGGAKNGTAAAAWAAHKVARAVA